MGTREGYLRNGSGRCLRVAQMLSATGEGFLVPGEVRPLCTACFCPLVEGLQQLPGEVQGEELFLLPQMC